MKLTLVICFFIMLSSLTGCALAPQKHSLPLGADYASKNKAYTIWYSAGHKELPLLAGVEWDTQEGEYASLGLAFLQGKRLAQCRYTKNALSCTLDPALPQKRLQSMVYAIALLLPFTLAEGTLPQNLPQGWHCTEKTTKKQTFIQKSTQSSLSFQTEYTQE